MILRTLRHIAASLTLVSGLAAGTSAYAQPVDLEAAFDNALGTQIRAPQTYDAIYESPLESRIARLADGNNGRIGVYAIDLTSGAEIGVLADQRFPLASTSKVAIAAAYLAGVDQGRWSLTSEWRLPRRNGAYMTAQRHLDLMISKSCNACTDALLGAVGGPRAVNAWMRNVGITDFELTRDIASLVRDDGRIDPASTIERQDSATPRAMGQLLAGVYRGAWLSHNSRDVLLNAMAQTTTGKKRMPAALPASAGLAHKTGTLSRTASDIGIFHTADGRAIAAAIYVTGQSASMAAENGNRSRKLEARRQRDARISSITRELYNGFSNRDSNQDANRTWVNATYGGG